MESLDILILGVEAAIALAGFAGIISTFQIAGSKAASRADAVGLTMVLQFSLLAALMSALPFVLYTFGVKETTLWAVCSVLEAIIYIVSLYAIQRNLKGSVRTKSFKRLILAIQCQTLFIVLINVLNTADIFFHREAGPVIAAIAWSLCLAGYMFSRLLLRPIWRDVHRQEAAKLTDATSG
ncbi:hypothetical protein R0135_01115 [Congregibacter variabilis]|uniref:Uncharacterized protein n=1 Tax=Congregibacter variabilis TaxID=3081200 RepID=A0ABZ0I416_9GAMM|nr:hypothetical protein R0135_01115 [Congregibacter sp. IMCC43200]